jgi:hypothetical protein
MKLRTIATVAAAVMGLSILSTSAYARDARWDGNQGYGYSQNYSQGHHHSRGRDCNDRRHYSQYRHHGRFAGRHDRGRHDGWRGHDRRRGDGDRHHRRGRDGHNGWRNH